MSITTPINKCTEKIIEDDGRIAYKAYGPHNPHYYMDKTGSYHSIDVTDTQTITKDSVGVIKLRKKHIVSVGLRTDGNKTKYLGLRLDETQEDGTHQFEWTINEAIINNTTQSITLNQTSSINNLTTNLGGQVVQSTRYYTRQMVPVTGSISNFKVKYTLDLTGLQISNTKYTEDTTIRNNISSSGTITVGTDYYEVDSNGFFKISDNDNNVKFRISEPVLLDSNLDVIQHISQSVTSGSETYNSYISNSTTHTLKDNGDGTYEYTKYPSDDLLKTQITGSVKYIDATTIYGETDLDGGVLKSGFGVNHATAHNASSGVSNTGTATDDNDALKYKNSFSGVIIGRIFFGIDTTSISVVPASAELRIKTKTNRGAGGIFLEATHTGISNSTYNDFTGWESGFDGDNIGGSGAGDELVKYTDSEFFPFAADGAYSEIGLNSTALAAIAANDTWLTVGLEHDHDFKNASIGTDVKSGFYFADSSGTSNDPHLYIVLPEPISHKLILLSGNLTINSGTLIIK